MFVFCKRKIIPCIFVCLFLFYFDMQNFTLRFSFLLIILSICGDSFCESLNSETLAEKSKLENLKDVVDPKNMETILVFEEEAKKESSHLYLAHAYYSKSIYYTINYNEDSISHYIYKGFKELDLLKEQIHKFTKDDKDAYQRLRISFANSIVHYCFTNNQYDLALIYINRMLEEANLGEYPIFEYEAYYLLGVCHLQLKQGEAALESFKKAYNIYENIPHDKPFSYHRPFRGMSHAFLILEDYDNMIAINDSVEKQLDKDFLSHQNQEFFYYQSKYVINNEVALAFVRKGDLQDARKRLDQSERILAEHLKDTPLKHAYYEVEAQYYSAKGDHKRAKEYIDLSLSSSHAKLIYKNFSNYLIGNLIKADILNKAGDNKEAYDLLRDLYQKNDSVSTVRFSKQVAEIQTLYNVDKLKLESEKNKAEIKVMRNILFGAGLFLILLVYIIYVTRRNAKVLRSKNKRLFDQYSEIENRNKTIQDLQLVQPRVFQDSSIEPDSYQELMCKLEVYLNTTQEYRKPGLTREELALEIGTNRQYLIEAIKEKTGKTFNEYIYSFRLKYAYDSIVNDKTKSITEILLESGFSTKGTFNRNFKETFGMTPSELRDIVLESE